MFGAKSKIKTNNKMFTNNSTTQAGQYASESKFVSSNQNNL